MRKLLSTVISLGITPGLPFSRQNKIRIFNVANLCVFFICIFYIIISFSQGEYSTVLLPGAELLFTLFTFYLNYKMKCDLAFHFGLITSLLFICGFAIIFGEKAQTQVYFLFFPVASIILFDKTKTIIFYFILSLVLIVTFKNFLENHAPLYPYNPAITILGEINFIFTGAMLFLGVKQFKVENNNFNTEINVQRIQLKEKNKDITDSINYAKRIQKALMASANLLNKNLPEHFVLYQPKDIVSGDFYWAEQINSQFILAVCDCTGHGVPGAFMSLLNITKLNETVHEKKIIRPDLILNQVREDIIKVLNPEGTEETSDGMDAVLCSFNFANLKLDFAGANNPLWIVREGSLTEYKPDKMPVGMYSGIKTDFTLQSIDLQKGDIIYLFTDGYADQFGGPKGKKFKYSQLKELLLSIHGLPMKEQQLIIHQKLESWKDRLEQVDDILIMGVRV